MSLSRFFIDRPIFAWVVGLIIALAGIVAIPGLPIAPYPVIAPPTIEITAHYSGASAETLESSVTQIIEQSMTNLDGLLYISSSSESQGQARITLTFQNGTDPDTAQVQTQNRLQLAMPQLPLIVQQQGIEVGKSRFGNFLMGVGFISEDGNMSTLEMGDYIATHLIDPVSRLPGVGGTILFGSKHAMRIWLDPSKLATYALTPGDIVSAIRAQNAQVSVGQLGGTPLVKGQQLNATVTSQSRLETPEQFRTISLRTNGDGSVLRLGDVARVELGAENYDFSSQFNGTPSAGLGVLLASNANALSTAKGVYELMKRLEPTFPRGMKAFFPHDVTPFVRASIHEVVKTLLEAMILVVLVMYLFLQSWRATLIPAIAVPVVLLGTFVVISAFGYSVNMLTMFAVVLAIGLLVDDAIVVVENVERVMAEEGCSPAEATRKSMDQITSALIGIATVLAAVFVPMAFLQGSTGVIYRQFSVTIVSAMILSVVVAVVMTPALCATLLKPLKKGEHGSNRGFFRWFNRHFDSGNRKSQTVVAGMLARTGRFMLVYLGIVVVMGFLFLRLPTAFLPDEDQGVLFAQVQTPAGATQPRTAKALAQVRDFFLSEPGVKSIFTIQGFSFFAGGQNSGIGFTLLKPWEEREDPKDSAQAIAGRAMGALWGIKDAMAFAFSPPPVPELGLATGFDFYLKDDQGQGHQALINARNQLLMLAMQDKKLANMRPNSQEDAPQFHLDVDSQKAGALGLDMADVNETLGIAWGGRYIDDFIDRGRVKRVYVQADAPFRMVPEDFGQWYVRNSSGGMVPATAFASSRWEYGPAQLTRYNGVPAVQINGQAAPGISSGTAMAEIEKLVEQLPKGFSVEWTGQSYQEIASGAQVPMLYTLSLIVVFLCLAALYESWSMPTSILLAVPLGIIGAILATSLRGFSRDIYFQVAMLTTVGLSGKNAILIVEFAKEYYEQGRGLIESTIHAVNDRLRPILMTSLAFGLGVLPLAVATGAGAGARRAIGTGVVGGMITGTFLGVFFVPLFFVVIQRLSQRIRGRAPAAAPGTPATAYESPEK